MSTDVAPSETYDTSDDSSFDARMAKDAENDAEEEIKIKERQQKASEVSLEYSRELQRLGLGGSLAPATWAKPIRTPSERKQALIAKVERLHHAENVLSKLEPRKQSEQQRGKKQTASSHPAVVLNLGLQRRPSKRVAVLVDISDSESTSSGDECATESSTRPRKGRASNCSNARSTAAVRKSPSSAISPKSTGSGMSTAPTTPLRSKQSASASTRQPARGSNAGRNQEDDQFHLHVEPRTPTHPNDVNSPLDRCLSLALQLHVVSEQLTARERKRYRRELQKLDGIEQLAELFSGAAARKMSKGKSGRNGDSDAPPPLPSEPFQAQLPLTARPSYSERKAQRPPPELPSDDVAVADEDDDEASETIDMARRLSDAILKLDLSKIHHHSESNRVGGDASAANDGSLDSQSDGGALVRSQSMPVVSGHNKQNGPAEPGTPRSRARRLQNRVPKLPSKNAMLKS